MHIIKDWCTSPAKQNETEITKKRNVFSTCQCLYIVQLDTSYNIYIKRYWRETGNEKQQVRSSSRKYNWR